jgi:hypothetical protein
MSGRHVGRRRWLISAAIVLVSVVGFIAAVEGASDSVSDVWHRIGPTNATFGLQTPVRAKYSAFRGNFVGEIRRTAPPASASSRACIATKTETHANQTQSLEDLAEFLFEHAYNIVTLRISIAIEQAGMGSVDFLDRFTILSSDGICSGEGRIAVTLEDEAAETAGLPSAIAFNSKVGRIDIVGEYYISRAEALGTGPQPTVMFHRIIN